MYQFKDHLDNVRLSYTKNDAGNLEIIEESNYYPFGLKHKGYNSTVSSLGNSTAQLLGFGGKEEQDELGIGWIDITARNYDPELGRWMNLDPLAELMRRHSPYNYGFDNPIFFQDPDGMMPCPTGDCPDLPNTNVGPPPVDSSLAGNTSATSPGSVGSSVATGTDVVRSVAAEGAYTGIQSDRVRNQYKNTVSKLDVTDSKGRTRAKMKARDNTPAMTRALIESKRPSSVEKRKTSGTANKTNAKANNTAKNIGRAGKALLVVGVVASANNIANAENKVEATATEGGAWGGAIVGGEMGATAGSAGGPWGALAGGVLGSIFGGTVGEEAVRDALNTVPAMERKTTIAEDIEIGDLSPRQMIRKHSCFVKGTKVLMADGSEKNIENIKAGDSILSVDVNTMKLEHDVVLMIPTELKKYRKIVAKFDNGTITEFSPAHPYYVEDKGWSVFDLKEAEKELKFNVSKLEKGDIVFFYENETLKKTKILSLEETNEFIEMYNVENVKKNHTFFANKILVHNKYLADERE